MIDGRNTTRPPGESEPVTVGEIREMAALRERVDRIERVIWSLSVQLGFTSELAEAVSVDRDKGAA